MMFCGSSFPEAVQSEQGELCTDYASLIDVLRDALDQASNGKGKERHAVAGEPFEDQQICEISRRLKGGVAGGPLFQAVKKIYESQRLGGEAGVRELLGAINYIGAAIIVMREDADVMTEEKKRCCIDQEGLKITYKDCLLEMGSKRNVCRYAMEDKGTKTKEQCSHWRKP